MPIGRSGGTAARPGDRSISNLLYQDRWLVVAIILLVALAYGGTLWNGFIWDDNDYVTENETLRSLAGLAAIWTDRSATPQYYPLVHSTFWLEYHLWGLNPMPYHITNAILHAMTAVGLWFVLRELSIPGAWLCAAIFAVHPVHVESVAWITERKNVLSGLFYVFAFLSLLRFQQRTTDKNFNQSGWRSYYQAMLLFVAALLSKSVTCTLPAAFLVVIWWRDARVSTRIVTLLLPFFFIGILSALNTAVLERSQVGAQGDEFAWTTAERLQIAGTSLWMYLWKLLVPLNLCFFYPKWELDAGKVGCWIAPILGLASVTLLVVTVSRVGRGPLASFLFFGGTLFPALGFFNVFPMRYSYFADHFQYLASVGPITLAGSSLWQLTARLPNNWGSLRAVLATGMLLLLASISSSRSLVYRDLWTLWQDTLVKNPKSDIALNNLAALELRQGNRDKAQQLYVRSLIVKPQFNYEATANLLVLQGEELAMAGKLDEAILKFREAADVGLENGRPHFSLGLVLLEKKEVRAAIEAFEHSLRLDEKQSGTHYHLARAYVLAGNKSLA